MPPKQPCLRNVPTCIVWRLECNWFSLAKVIRSDQYFGQYGVITSVISSIDDTQSYNTVDSSHVKSYITYSNEKDAAMAISVNIYLTAGCEWNCPSWQNY